MVTVDIQSWASAASVLAVMLTAIGMLSRKTDTFRAELKGDIAGLRTELKGDIAGLRTELKSDIAGLRTDLRADIGRVESRLSALEQRTFELSIRLPPLPTPAP